MAYYRFDNHGAYFMRDDIRNNYATPVGISENAMSLHVASMGWNTTQAIDVFDPVLNATVTVD